MRPAFAFFLAAAAAITGACQTTAPIATVSATIPLATSTVPIPTATATSTPPPTIPPATPTIAPPQPVLEYLTGAQVVSLDTMDEPGKWDLYAGTIADGVLEVRGNNDWNGLIRKGSTLEGTGVIISFKYTSNPEFEIFFDHGDWDTEPYRRFGVYILSYPRTNLWQGRNSWWKPLQGNFEPKPDTWYSMLMAIGKDGEFLAIIWDLSNPSKTIAYHEDIGRDWAGLTWTFKIGANVGTAQFDDFMRISFADIK